MLADRRLQRSIANIQQRAERLEDPGVLVATFVDTGAIVQLENTSNQILFGRRGSGKTHVLRVLREQARDAITVYIDCRVLGSSGHYSAEVGERRKAAGLFRDIAHEVSNALLETATELVDADQAERALNLLGELDDCLFNPQFPPPARATIRRGSERRGGSTVSGEASISTRPLSVSGGIDRSAGATESLAYEVVAEERINFGYVNELLARALEALGGRRLLLLIDEWAEIESPEQPFVAEYLKKAFFANPKVTVKIAALEYRSNFNTRQDRGLLGLEIGGDIFAAADLDDYFLPDRNPDQVQAAYAQLLTRHLASNAEDDVLHELRISEGNIQSRLFTQAPVFNELVRASEGVPRDFINIFVQAAFDALRRSRDTIDMQSISNAARKWYEQDKRRNLSEEQQEVLQRIVGEVIGEKKARCFMIEQAHAEHAMVKSLYDLRVIHRLKAGYSGRDQPGVRYDIYALDYGTYLDLKNTAGEPDPDFVVLEGNAVGDDIAVPFDDHRSIRRIILTPDLLQT
ncbi:MAG: hypothetical protein U0446_02235 [Dehalococcoidia bacterium]